MERTCRRAIELGLPAVAFTEHADYTRWTVVEGSLDGFDELKPLVADGTLVPPPLDLDGYLECVDRCRARFPDLRIISGVELGEPHWHSGAASTLLRDGGFERVLGSLHCLRAEDRFVEAADLYRERNAADVVRGYLAEIASLIEGFADFAVLAHLDYAIRDWPASAGPFDPAAFEDEFRHALRALATAGRALEVNTRGPRHPEVVRWWREEGGEAVTFGSDAHEPAALARLFGEAAAMVEANGFRAGRHPFDVWIRSS
jgi:histidinol-phosphatase (PHP family)